MPLQLTYISSAARGVGFDNCPAILEASRRNNGAVGVTGLLMFDGLRFLQALEGEASAVLATIRRIREDARHRSIVVLSEREVPATEFGDWSMAFERGGSSVGKTSLADSVDALVADLESPNLKALFEGFARIERRVA